MSKQRSNKTNTNQSRSSFISICFKDINPIPVPQQLVLGRPPHCRLPIYSAQEGHVLTAAEWSCIWTIFRIQSIKQHFNRRLMCALHCAEHKIHNEKEESLIDPKSNLSLGALKNKVDGICRPPLRVAEITCATPLVRNLALRPHVFCAEVFYFCGFQTHTGLYSEEHVFYFSRHLFYCVLLPWR